MAAPAFSVSYVDFNPACVKRGGILSQPVFERFDSLVKRANDWLRSNPQFKVKTIESLESMCPYSTEVVDTVTSTYIESGKQMNAYNRSLRLWITSKNQNDPPHPQQLGYYNVVPACISEGGFFSEPQFESFAVTIDKVNQLFRQNPLPGRIINIETQDIKFHTWSGSIDPDEGYWREPGNVNIFFLNVIRIFYEASQYPAMEEIGCADFVPQMVAAGGMLTPNSYEFLSGPASRAHHWMQQQQGIRVTNIQAIDYKVSSNWGGGSETVDTMRSMYREYGKGTTRYLRIIRVCFTRSPNHPVGTPAGQLTYRTFMPAKLTSGGMFTPAVYEPQTETMKRAQCWCNATGAKIISCETVTVRSGTGAGNPEVTYTWNYGNISEYMIFVIRVYMDGVYQDPPPEMLPPVPQIQQSGSGDCCTIL